MRWRLLWACCYGAGAEALSTREALVALYEATGGETWHRKAGWLQHTRTCNWELVTCNRAGDVTGLDLRGGGLVGTLPAAMGALTAIETVDLRDSPRISGTLPPQLGGMSALRSFQVEANGLSGTIPPELIAPLQSLKKLRVQSNELSGTLPAAALSIAGLRGMEQLHINRPRGVSAIGKLSGTIADFMVNSWAVTKGLYEIEIEGNLVSGTLPVDFGRLTRLEELEVDIA